MTTHFLRSLARFAREHGCDARIEKDAVVVSDRDGFIVTSSIIELRRWLGY